MKKADLEVKRESGSVKRWLRDHSATGLVLTAVGLPIGALVYTTQTPTALPAFAEVGGKFVSWPYVTAALGVAILLMFREPLSAAIGRVHRVKGLGGEIELQSPATPPAPETADHAAKGEEVALQAQLADQIAQTENHPSPPPEQLLSVLRLVGEDLPKVTNVEEASQFAGRILFKLKVATEERARWRHFYFSWHLVPGSKFVLKWFAEQMFVSREAFEVAWKGALPEDDNRAIILTVLVAYRLLEETRGMFSVTDDGRAFLEFLREHGAFYNGAVAPYETYAMYPPQNVPS